MAKMRGIKPEIWTDERFIELSPLARLLFIGMWNYACDNGHVEDKPKQLRLRILPSDDCDVPELLMEMIRLGMVQRSIDCLTIPNLPAHQRIDKRYFTACEHCPPDVHTTGTPRAPSVHTTGTRVEGRKEGEMKEGEGERSAAGTRRARQLPASWKPNAHHHTFASDNHLNLGEEVEQFKDHHRAKGSTMKDWDASFRTWLRNSVKWRKEAPTPAGQNWGTPASLPPCPAEVADDSRAYAEWLRDWNAGKEVPTADGSKARRSS